VIFYGFHRQASVYPAGLHGMKLAQIYTETICTKLKIGAAIVRNTRHVRMLQVSQHPLQHAGEVAARALTSF
jgi:hypothetical protein